MENDKGGESSIFIDQFPMELQTELQINSAFNVNDENNLYNENPELISPPEELGTEVPSEIDYSSLISPIKPQNNYKLRVVSRNTLS